MWKIAEILSVTDKNVILSLFCIEYYLLSRCFICYIFCWLNKIISRSFVLINCYSRIIIVLEEIRKKLTVIIWFLLFTLSFFPSSSTNSRKLISFLIPIYQSVALIHINLQISQHFYRFSVLLLLFFSWFFLKPSILLFDIIQQKMFLLLFLF